MRMPRRRRRRWLPLIPLCLSFLALALPGAAQDRTAAFATTASRVATDAKQQSSRADAQRTAIERTRLLIEEIRAASFPELKDAIIKVELLRSDADFFRTRFSLPHFFMGRRMRFLLKVNPRVFELGAPDTAVRAIIAHELAHVVYYQRKRLCLLGLTRLASKKFTARFERWTDLQAISRGYGEGLQEYRRWLYQHVPARKLREKQRNYFSPEEIAAIQAGLQRRAELLAHWLKKVPLSLMEIEAQQCPRFR
jgi:hypothetical protein